MNLFSPFTQVVKSIVEVVKKQNSITGLFMKLGGMLPSLVSTVATIVDAFGPDDEEKRMNLRKVIDDAFTELDTQVGETGANLLGEHIPSEIRERATDGLLAFMKVIVEDKAGFYPKNKE